MHVLLCPLLCAVLMHRCQAWKGAQWTQANLLAATARARQPLANRLPSPPHKMLTWRRPQGPATTPRTKAAPPPASLKAELKAVTATTPIITPSSSRSSSSRTHKSRFCHHNTSSRNSSSSSSSSRKSRPPHTSPHVMCSISSQSCRPVQLILRVTARMLALARLALC